MWTIFKVFIEFVTILILFILFSVLFFWPRFQPRGLWNLSSPTRDQTLTPCTGWEVKSPWCPRGVLRYMNLILTTCRNCKPSKREELVFSFHIQLFLCASRAEHTLRETTLSFRLRRRLRAGGAGPPGASCVHTPSTQALQQVLEESD